MANTRPSPPSGAQTVIDEPSLAVRLHYWFEPGKDEAARRAIAEIFMRPCFAPLERVAWDNDHGRTTGHTIKSHAVIEAYLGNPLCDMVKLDSGRNRELVAVANVWTGWTDLTHGGLNELKRPADWVTVIVLPHDPDQVRARVQACCDLARVLRVFHGAISNEVCMGAGHEFGLRIHPSPLEEALKDPGMSVQRVRERECQWRIHETWDQEIGSPEWGMFLGREHLRRLPLERIEASGVFARVDRLAEDLAYIQLTDDPMDALRDEYDQMLEPARAVLAPIQADLSRVRVVRAR